MLKGIGVSPGISIGKALVTNDKCIEIEKRDIEDRSKEKARFHDAVKEAKCQLTDIMHRAQKNIGNEEGRIFDAHILMLEDPELVRNVEMVIENEKANAEYAVKISIDTFAEMLSQIDDEYMRERAADIRDVGSRLLNILTGNKGKSLSDIKEKCIVVSYDISPSDTAQMNKENILGFIMDVGGRTSHSAIMARSLGIPAVVGIQNASKVIKNNDMLIIDGSGGIVIIDPDENILKKYYDMKKRFVEEKYMLMKLKDEKSVTLDNKKVELAANIGTVSEVQNALDNGCEGIGLFRTEFLYMDKDYLPTEEEQLTEYKQVLEQMGDRPVVIRTLDIGGDKKLPCLPLNEEMNPFLGFRAIRLCLDRKDIFITQLRALLRASIYGNLKVMFPMISNLQELREVKNVIEEVRQELLLQNIKFADNVEIGIMIEIPSAAVISDILIEEVDFFSIGTNDLIQYTTAVDRMNEKVAYLYDPYHPAVLRLIKMVIDNAHKGGKWVGMCGEMAGDPSIIPVLFGMGLDEFSMSPVSILKAREIIRKLNFENTREVVEKILKLKTSDEIRTLIKSSNF